MKELAKEIILELYNRKFDFAVNQSFAYIEILVHGRYNFTKFNVHEEDIYFTISGSELKEVESIEQVVRILENIR